MIWTQCSVKRLTNSEKFDFELFYSVQLDNEIKILTNEIANYTANDVVGLMNRSEVLDKARQEMRMASAYYAKSTFSVLSRTDRGGTRPINQSSQSLFTVNQSINQKVKDSLWVSGQLLFPILLTLIRWFFSPLTRRSSASKCFFFENFSGKWNVNGTLRKVVEHFQNKLPSPSFENIRFYQRS